MKIGEVAETILDRLGFNVRGSQDSSSLRRAPLKSTLFQSDDITNIVDEAAQNRVDLQASFNETSEGKTSNGSKLLFSEKLLGFSYC